MSTTNYEEVYEELLEKTELDQPFKTNYLNTQTDNFEGLGSFLGGLYDYEKILNDTTVQTQTGVETYATGQSNTTNVPSNGQSNTY
jgi:hypothetical protein